MQMLVVGCVLGANITEQQKGCEFWETKMTDGLWFLRYKGVAGVDRQRSCDPRDTEGLWACWCGDIILLIEAYCCFPFSEIECKQLDQTMETLLSCHGHHEIPPPTHTHQTAGGLILNVFICCLQSLPVNVHTCFVVPWLEPQFTFCVFPCLVALLSISKRYCYCCVCGTPMSSFIYVELKPLACCENWDFQTSCFPKMWVH